LYCILWLFNKLKGLLKIPLYDWHCIFFNYLFIYSRKKTLLMKKKQVPLAPGLYYKRIRSLLDPGSSHGLPWLPILKH